MPSDSNPSTLSTSTGRAPANTVSFTGLRSIPGSNTSADVLSYNGGPDWHDGTTNPGTTVGTQLDKIISDLVNNAGADRIGFAGYSYLGAGSIQDGFQELIDDLAVDTSATAGSTRIGASPVGGYYVSEVQNATVLAPTGGIGDSTELANPTVEDVFGAVDNALLRRRAFTATIANAGSAVFLADVMTDDLDSDVWDILNDQASQRGGTYYLHARDLGPASFTLATDMPGPGLPYLLGEARHDGNGIFLSEASTLNNIIIQSTVADSELRGVWDGFSFLPSGTNQFQLQSGFTARNCFFYDDAILLDNNGSIGEERTIRFENCNFTRTNGNTTGACCTLTSLGSGASHAIFDGCLFGGGSGSNTTALEITQLGSASNIAVNETIVEFRTCIFNAAGSGQAIFGNGAGNDQTIIFENCVIIGNSTSSSFAVTFSSDPNIIFRGCQFYGSPHLLSGNFGGVIEDCTFHTDVDKVNVNLSLINLDPIGALGEDQLKFINNRVFLDGDYGDDDANATPAVDLGMTALVVDGLYIEYLPAVSNMAQNTLTLDYNNEAAAHATDARNIHIALNHKTVQGFSASTPSVFIASGTGANSLSQHTIHNLKITGIDVGGPSGFGDQGRVVTLGDGIALWGAELRGSMDSGTTAANQLWEHIVLCGNYCHLDKVRLAVEAGGDWVPVGHEGTFELGSHCKMTDCWFDTDGTANTLTLPEAVVHVTGDYCTIEDCTFIHDPVEQPTLQGDSEGGPVNGLTVVNNHFFGNDSNARNGSVIEIQNGNYASVTGNFIQHRGDGAGSPKAIAVLSQDNSRVKDNTVERLASDLGGSLINHTGTNIITADNIVA